MAIHSGALQGSLIHHAQCEAKYQQEVATTSSISMSAMLNSLDSQLLRQQEIINQVEAFSRNFHGVFPTEAGAVNSPPKPAPASRLHGLQQCLDFISANNDHLQYLANSLSERL